MARITPTAKIVPIKKIFLFLKPRGKTPLDIERLKTNRKGR